MTTEEAMKAYQAMISETNASVLEEYARAYLEEEAIKKSSGKK
jgi:hypothetical protein